MDRVSAATAQFGPESTSTRSGASDSLTPDETCAGEIHATERAPLDMYFLVDTSGSMAAQTAGGSKWDMVRSALVRFLEDPVNADVGVGIGYFPAKVPTSCAPGEPDCLCIPFTPICVVGAGGSCEAADYSAPAVPFGFPPQPEAIVADLTQRTLAGGTPTRPALEGALEYVQTWAAANPGRRTVVVLATDGDPVGCTGNAPGEVAELAAAALAGETQVKTFVVGVGRSLTSLNGVAAAGGTTQAFLTDTGSSLVQDLADALLRIRSSALPCEFAIPEDTERGGVDPRRINLLLTPAQSTASVVVPMTSSGLAQGCDTAGGWYYDNPNQPTAVRLCESTCRETLGARIELQFGCETIQAQLR